MAASQFYATLPSTSSTRYFPNNKLSSYTTRLHTPLRLTGDWEVALVEVSYPRTWYNVSGNTCKIFYKGRRDTAMQTTMIPPGYYDNVEDILHEVRSVIPEDVKRGITMYVKTQSRKCVITCSNGSQIQFNETLARMLGFEESEKIFKDSYGTFPVDVHRGFYTFYVYSDIVSSQYVGDTLAPLLRTVEVDHTAVGGMVCRTYNSPHYVPVKLRDIETIRVDLRLDSGELLPFESGQVICKVHFRVKRSPYLV